MDSKTPIRGAYAGILMPIQRFIKDRAGLGGVEFAILAPILISLYISCFELTMGFTVSKRVTRATATIADLITQQTSVNETYLGTMVDVAEAIFMPYNTSAAKLTLKITGVAMDASGTPKVAWSWDKLNGQPYAVGATVSDVPTDMKVANTFLIRAELSVPHELLLFLPNLVSSSDTRSITMGRTYFYRPRVGNSITCSNC
jgi:Flp pilus assembly protein TadG